MDEEKIYREKVLKIGAISIGICLIIAHWYATQGVAAECNYHAYLGNFLQIGELKIYAPYKFYVWQNSAHHKKIRNDAAIGSNNRRRIYIFLRKKYEKRNVTRLSVICDGKRN